MLKKKSHSINYRADIDGLRAISVISVIGFHTFPNNVKAGFIGVDIFFVISGYLISRIIFEQIELNSFSFFDFYKRRIRRIFPALIFVLSACFIFGWFTLFPIEFQQLGKHIAGSAGFISNFILWNEAGYFDNEANTKPLLHIWSLGIEEQFYIFWPLIIWIIYKTRINFFLIIFILIGFSFVFNIFSAENDKVATFYSPITRFWELLVGSLLAWLKLKSNYLHLNISTKNLLSFFGIIFIIYAFIAIDNNSIYPGFLGILPVFGAFLIMSAGPEALFNRLVLSNKIAVWIGLISFPLYLWHWPLISFARIIQSDFPNENYRVVAIILSIVLSWLTFKYIEKPIRSKTNSNLIPITLLTSMFIIGLIGLFSYLNKGVPSRSYISNFNEENFKMAFLFPEDDEIKHQNCMNTYDLKNNIRYCNLSSSKKPKIAIIGDSHARAMYDGLAYVLKNKGEGVLNLGGRLFLDIKTYPKGEKKEIEVYKGGIEATKFVIKEPSIKTIIMVSKGHYLTDTRWIFKLISDPNITDRSKIWEIGMRKTLDSALKNNKQVIFVIDNPNLKFDPKQCLAGRPLSRNLSIKQSCTILRSTYEKESKIYRDLVLSVLNDYPEVKIFDTSKYLCDDVSCYGMKDGKILYRDQDHLSFAGGKLLSKELIKLIEFP